MKKQSNDADSRAIRDDVERCRRVRRRLEKQLGGFDGLCDWLTALQKRRDGMRHGPRKGGEK